MIRNILISSIVSAFLIIGGSYIAQSQTIGDPPITTYHTSNNCEVYVNQWDTGLVNDGTQASIYTSLMPDSSLYNVQITAVVQLNEDYAGRVTVLIDKLAKTDASPDWTHHYNTYDFVDGSWSANQEVVFTITFPVKIGSVVELIPEGTHHTLITVELPENIPGFLRIDTVRVKRTPGIACDAH